MVYSNGQHRPTNHPQTASPGQHGNRTQQAGWHGNEKRGQNSVFPGNSLGSGRSSGGPDAGISGFAFFLLGKFELWGAAVGAEQFGCAQRRATSMAEQIHSS